MFKTVEQVLKARGTVRDMMVRAILDASDPDGGVGSVIPEVLCSVNSMSLETLHEWVCLLESNDPYRVGYYPDPGRFYITGDK